MPSSVFLRVAAALVAAALVAAVLVALVTLVGALGSLPAHAADVQGDDAGDRYVGTGGLILPSTVGSQTRHEVASCAGCQWRLTSPCVRAEAGVAFGGQPECRGVVRGCPSGELLRSWFRPEAGPWRETGLICLADGGPVTVRDAGTAVAEALERRLPRLSVRAQPATGVLAQLPVYFSSGQQAGPVAWSDRLLGQQVDIVAVPTWSWDFGDGARMRTTEPGGRYPTGRVAHAFRRDGPATVSCTVDWAARFVVDGLGPFPVPGQVRQEDTVVVEVGEGRAVLTGGGMAQ